MLQAIRTRAGGIVVKVLFGLLILSFGFWGIYTRSPYYQSHSPDTVVAEVGDRDIRAEELQTVMQAAIERLRAQLGGSIDAQQIKKLGVADTLLNQLIDRSLLDQEVARLRLDVPDDTIRSAIYDNPAFRGPDGQFDRNLFNQTLTMNRLTEDQLVARLRAEIPRSDLLQSLTVGVVAPSSLVDLLYRYRNEKRVADIVAFPVAAVGNMGPPADADLTKFYDAHPDSFRTPEYRGFTVASLTVADMAKGSKVPDDRLKKEFDERKDEFVAPERRDVEQLLAPSEDKAKEAVAAVAAGKDWKEVAKTVVGQDPDTVDLGLVTQKEMPRELAETAFQLPLDKPSDPIHSAFGWHVLRVTKIVPPTSQSFDQVKTQLAAEMAQEEAADRLDKLGNQVDDALAGGATLAEAAAKFGLKTTTIATTDIGGRDPAGKPISLPLAANEILKSAFDMNANDTSRVTQAEDGAIYAIHLDKITPSAVQPLDVVKDQAIAAWQADQKKLVAAKQARELATAVPAGGALAKIAAEKKLTATTSPPLSRQPEQGTTVPPALIAKLFAAKKGDIVTSEDGTGAYVAQLKEVQAPDKPPAQADKAMADELTNGMRLDIAGELTQALRSRFPVEIKRDALDRMF